MSWQIIRGDCAEAMAGMDDCSVDAICTDPPYGLEFMGRDWDKLGPAVVEEVTDTENRDGNWTTKPFGGGGQRVRYGTPGKSMQEWHEAWATGALRVLKPGGHLLAFGGTRTYHRLVCAVEDAGFEIRDTISWMYGSGFPKSLAVDKAIDRQRDDSSAIRAVTAFVAASRNGKSNRDIDAHFAFNGMAGHWTTQGDQAAVPTVPQWAELKTLLGLTDDMDAEVWRLNGRKGQPGENWELREKVGETDSGLHRGSGTTVAFGEGTDRSLVDVTTPATPEAERWQGWGTALKPAHEPIVVARKPLAGTVAANVLETGCGALNVDGCRIGMSDEDRAVVDTRSGSDDGQRDGIYHDGVGKREAGERFTSNTSGRWPANVVLSHTEECVPVGTRKVKTGTAVKRHGVTSEGVTGWGKAPPGTPDVTHADADGTETITTWACSPGYRVPVVHLGGLVVTLGVSPEQEVEDLLALALHRVRAADSRSSGTRTALTNGPSDDRWPSSPQGSPAGCRACPRCDDGHARLTAAAGQASVQLLADVLESVLHSGSSPRRSRVSKSGDPSSEDGSVPTSTAKRSPANRTAEVPAGVAPSEAQTPSGTKRTSPSPSPRAESRGSTPSSSTSGAFGEAPAIPCRSGHRCSGFLPLVSACLSSLRAWLPLSIEHTEWGQCPVRLLDEQTGELTSGSGNKGNRLPGAQGYGGRNQVWDSAEYQGDSGGASRFFYTAKSSRSERNAGLEGFEEQRVRTYEGGEIASAKTPDAMGGRRTAQNVHPTVKPIELMRWLCRLVTPPGGTVLDCFAGSGTTGIAAVLEGFNFIGIEREDEYADIAEARIGWWEKHKGDGQAAAVLAAGEAREAVEATGQASFFDEDAA